MAKFKIKRLVVDRILALKTTTITTSALPNRPIIKIRLNRIGTTIAIVFSNVLLSVIFKLKSVRLEENSELFNLSDKFWTLYVWLNKLFVWFELLGKFVDSLIGLKFGIGDEGRIKYDEVCDEMDDNEVSGKAGTDEVKKNIFCWLEWSLVWFNFFAHRWG